MRNILEYVESLVACLKIRAVPINVNFRYTKSELAYLYNNSKIVTLVVHDEFIKNAKSALPQYPGAQSIVAVASESKSPVVINGFEGRTHVQYEKAMLAGSPVRSFSERSESDHFIIYTGGTTGMPKGVAWRHEDFYFAALSIFTLWHCPEPMWAATLT